MKKKYRSPCTYNRLWRIWRKMRERGGLIAAVWFRRQRDYKYYRHVFVCDLWAHHFKAFEWWAKRNGYRDDLQIDRIDWRGGYCPSNCRWVTRSEQNKNRHMTRSWKKHLRRIAKLSARARWAKRRASHV